MSGTPSFRARDRIIAITGGAGGIGQALSRRFVSDGARLVVLLDVDDARTRAVAAEIGGPVVGWQLDVADPVAVRRTIERIEAEHGAIDLWCGNAGIVGSDGLGAEQDWSSAWNVNVLAHVTIARELIPRMIDRGSGHLLITASAAGLLTSLDSAAYSASKHAAVALAEWLAIEYGDAGIGISCLCPQAVRTPMIAGRDGLIAVSGTVIEPTDLAAIVSQALADGVFLILSHPEVADFERRRALDRERWLAGMVRLKHQQYS